MARPFRANMIAAYRAFSASITGHAAITIGHVTCSGLATFTPANILLDNYDGSAGAVVGTQADTGQDRIILNGSDKIVLLSGTGYAYLDDVNTADIALQGWDPAPSVGSSNTIKVTLTAHGGDSEQFVFNADLTGSGTGWLIRTNTTDGKVAIQRYTSLYPQVGDILDNDHVDIPGGIANDEQVEVTITFSADGDSIIYSAKGTSKTYTKLNRTYKNQTGIAMYFDEFDNRLRCYKVQAF